MTDDNKFMISQQTKEEIQAIKDDIQDIAKRLQNIKGEALHHLLQDSGQVMSAMNSIKDKIMDQGKCNIHGLYSCVEKNPMKSAMYCFGAGMLLTLLFRK